MLGVARSAAALLAALLLSACWEVAAIQLGGNLVIAGIDALTDSDTSGGSSSSSPQTAASVAEEKRFCRRAGTNQAYMNSAPHCRAGDTPITSTEFYSSSVVIVSAEPSEAKASYCYDSKIPLAYQRPSGDCGSDQAITREQYDRLRAEREKQKGAKAAALVAYCLVSEHEEPYQSETGRCESGHKRITAQQFETEMARFSGPETYCYDKAAQLEYKGNDGKCLSLDVRVSASAFEDFKKKRASKEEKPKAIVASAPSEPEAAEAAEAPQQVASIENLFVVPAIPDTAKMTASGTAFFVSIDGFALTNQHVIEGCKWVGLVRGDGLEPAAIVASDSDVDLALLRVTVGSKRVGSFRSGPPEVGEANYIVGHPLFGTLGEMNMTDGIVSSLSGPGGYPGLLQTSAPMQPGNSGGPVFGENGLVVGVAIGRLKDEQAENVNFAIKADEVLRFLSRNGVIPKSAKTGKVRPPKEIARDAREFTFPAICFE